MRCRAGKPPAPLPGEIHSLPAVSRATRSVNVSLLKSLTRVTAAVPVSDVSPDVMFWVLIGRKDGAGENTPKAASQPATAAAKRAPNASRELRRLIAPFPDRSRRSLTSVIALPVGPCSSVPGSLRCQDGVLMGSIGDVS